MWRILGDISHGSPVRSKEGGEGMTLEEINRTLVEAEGGCWHEPVNYVDMTLNIIRCSKCSEVLSLHEFYHPNPDFSQWSNFGRLLNIATNNRLTITLSQYRIIIARTSLFKTETYAWMDDRNIAQYPLLVATELARILREGKE